MTLSCVFGQSVKPKDTSVVNLRDFYVDSIDGFKVYHRLSKSDSIKILKDMVSKLNGKWISTEKLIPTEPEVKYTWDYQLNYTTFSGYLFNLDIILAAPFVKLKIINGQIKIINSRTIGQYFIDDSSSNIKIIGDQLIIDSMVYRRQKSKG